MERVIRVSMFPDSGREFFLASGSSEAGGIFPISVGGDSVGIALSFLLSYGGVEFAVGGVVLVGVFGTDCLSSLPSICGISPRVAVVPSPSGLSLSLSLPASLPSPLYFSLSSYPSPLSESSGFGGFADSRQASCYSISAGCSVSANCSASTDCSASCGCFVSCGYSSGSLGEFCSLSRAFVPACWVLSLGGVFLALSALSGFWEFSSCGIFRSYRAPFFKGVFEKSFCNTNLVSKFFITKSFYQPLACSQLCPCFVFGRSRIYCII